MLSPLNPTAYHAPPAGTLRYDAGRFKSLEHIGDLAALLETSPQTLQLLRANQAYHVYQIPKKDGAMQLIEDPPEQLKQTLHWLNHYLQAVYYFQRPEAVYGFCISCRDEEDRNVVNNARKHIGDPYVMVMDLHDFFHTVTIEMVYQTFNAQFPAFESKMIDTLTSISTYHDRLPMGSPASPVISNMAALGMDAELEGFCKAGGINYTRYADDMVFSARAGITDADKQMLRAAIVNAGFIVNEQKCRYYRPGENCRDHGRARPFHRRPAR